MSLLPELRQTQARGRMTGGEVRKVIILEALSLPLSSYPHPLGKELRSRLASRGQSQDPQKLRFCSPGICLQIAFLGILTKPQDQDSF